MKNISFLFVYILLIVGCREQGKVSFVLENSASKTIEDNINCLAVFDKALGIDKTIIEEQNYFEHFLDKIVQRNKGNSFEKFVYLNLIERGEISTFSVFTIGIKLNGEGVITKYTSKKEEFNEQKIIIENFNLSSFYERLGNEVGESDRLNTSLLVIEFENTENCNCRLYSIPFTEVKRMRDLSFFD